MVNILVKLIISYEIVGENSMIANFGLDLVIDNEAPASDIHDKIIEAIEANLLSLDGEESDMMNLKILSICQIDTKY